MLSISGYTGQKKVGGGGHAIESKSGIFRSKKDTNFKYISEFP